MGQELTLQKIAVGTLTEDQKKRVEATIKGIYFKMAMEENYNEVNKRVQQVIHDRFQDIAKSSATTGERNRAFIDHATTVTSIIDELENYRSPTKLEEMPPIEDEIATSVHEVLTEKINKPQAPVSRPIARIPVQQVVR